MCEIGETWRIAVIRQNFDHKCFLLYDITSNSDLQPSTAIAVNYLAS